MLSSMNNRLEATEINYEKIPVGTLSLQDLIGVAIEEPKLPEGFGKHLNYVVPAVNRLHDRRPDAPSLLTSPMDVTCNKVIT